MNEKICVFTGKAYDCNNCAGYREEWLGKGPYNAHMGHSVDGPLQRNGKKEWRGMARYMTKDDGSPVTWEHIKAEFMRYNAKGWRTIPMGKGCDRWCYKNGCQGHKQAQPT